MTELASRTSLFGAFLRAKRIAGITRRFRFHDLRHTAACTLASAGVSLQVIQKILGHTSSKMTERYVRVNDAAVAEARRATRERRSSVRRLPIAGTSPTDRSRRAASPARRSRSTQPRRRPRFSRAKGVVIARDDTRVTLPFDTLCIHADMPGAAERLRAIRDALA